MFYNTVRPAIANYYGTFISEYMEKNIACVCTYSANCHLTAEVQKDLNLAYVAIARIFSWPCFEIICLFFNLHVTSLTVTHEGNSFCVDSSSRPQPHHRPNFVAYLQFFVSQLSLYIKVVKKAFSITGFFFKRKAYRKAKEFDIFSLKFLHICWKT